MRTTLITFLVVLGLIACEEPADELSGARRRSRPVSEEPSADEVSPSTNDPMQPGACTTGVPHVGFASTDFVSDRKAGALGENRRRIKPFTAMRTELERVLGSAPADLDQSTAAFGEVPARWYAEPTAGAVSLFTTYTIAFRACYASMASAPYDADPTAASASAECAKLQRRAWQRSPTPAEIEGCSAFVLGLTTETVPRRRWAHACASVMTSAGFTTY